MTYFRAFVTMAALGTVAGLTSGCGSSVGSESWCKKMTESYRNADLHGKKPQEEMGISDKDLEVFFTKCGAANTEK